MFLAISDFRKDFDKCVTLYKEFLKQSGITPSYTRFVLEFSSGRRGGSGGKKVDYFYYTKNEYIKLSRD